MNRRMLVLGGLGLVGLGAGVAWWMQPSTEWSAPYEGGERWASLSPVLTETMFAIGAGSALVGRSSECTIPVPARRIRDLGPPLSPDPEGLGSLDLAGVMVLEGQSPAGVSDPWALPWGSVDEVAATVRELGVYFDVEDRAEVLAAAFEKDLAAPKEEPTGPRVMVLYEVDGTQARFVARNSLRGRAVEAAGLRHAVDQDFERDPTVVLADLVQLDPDVILVLHDEAVDTARREELLAPLAELAGLRAAQSATIDVLGSPTALSLGPSVLQLPPLFRQRVDALTGPADAP